METQNQNSFYTLDYIKFRVFIGFLGMSLPLFLLLITLNYSTFDIYILPSISHYYYSTAHVLFLLILFLLGLFLTLYNGKHTIKYEKSISIIAGTMCFLIAIFPTTKDEIKNDIFLDLCNYQYWFDYIHKVAAAILFGCFSIFCLYIFTKPENNYNTSLMLRKKARRNFLYTIFGIIIILCLTFIFLEGIDVIPPPFDNYLFYLEIIMLEAFGISWFIKGSEMFSKYRLFQIFR